MSASYWEIDVKNWKRATHCQVFRNSVQPQYGVSFELDITNFLPKIKARKLSFTFALIYATSRCANAIEEFRYRFLNGKVVLYDRIDTSFTYLNKDTELFKVVNVEMCETLEEYVALAHETERNQKEYFTGPMANDVFQFSPMPWVSFTHISHTESGKKDNATPIFDWANSMPEVTGSACHSPCRFITRS
jgi:chloramphenicol O-acetyltransferase type B